MTRPSNQSAMIVYLEYMVSLGQPLALFLSFHSSAFYTHSNLPPCFQPRTTSHGGTTSCARTTKDLPTVRLRAARDLHIGTKVKKCKITRKDRSGTLRLMEHLERRGAAFWEYSEVQSQAGYSKTHDREKKQRLLGLGHACLCKYDTCIKRGDC